MRENAEVKSFLHALPPTSWFNPDDRETAILKQPTEKQEKLRLALNKLFDLLDPKKSRDSLVF